MISISALTYKLFFFLPFYLDHDNSFSHLQSEIIRTEKKVNIPFGQHLLSPSLFYMYILSGTHMHTPEYRMGEAHPIVMIRSLCIV